jgi:hypothetical protein
MSTYYKAVKSAGINHTAATTPSSFKMHGDQLAVIFNGETKAQALPQDPNLHQTWTLQVIDIELPEPTRRPFKVRVNVDLQAVLGAASARITVDGHTTSRQVRSTENSKAFVGYLQLNLRRTTIKRDRIRVVLWTEAECKTVTGIGLAEIDSLDIFTHQPITPHKRSTQ